MTAAPILLVCAVWGYGTILYQLLSGYHLFPHNLIDGKLARIEQSNLAEWQEPNEAQLRLVLLQAGASAARRLVAKDLVALLLQGEAKNR